MPQSTSWSGARIAFPTAVRRRILRKQPVCAGCRIRPSTIADHIIPVAEGGTDSESNGQGLCTVCHDAKTKQEAARGRARKLARLRRPEGRHPGLLP